jgi:alpha,alpha-trehalase
VAAPTTSLPEWPGGIRNWDYRYVWVRDAAFTAQAFLLLGHLREAREYVRWVVGRLDAADSAERLGILYDARGGPVPRETTLDHWEGYERSQPVRIGNAAVHQLQLDIYGEVLDAVAGLAPHDPESVREVWPSISRLVDQAVDRWDEPDAGIWESRDPPRHYVHSKVMCWVAADRGVRLGELLGRTRSHRRWQRAADRIRKEVLDRGFDRERGTFVESFERRRMDASVLRIPLTGFLPFDDTRVRSTVAAVERELADGPYVRRYPPEGARHGPEGSFLLCGFWLVECLARGGDRERAVRNFRVLLKSAGPLRLFSEEYDPVRRRLLGNYPQAFTHIGVLRAALALGLPPGPRRTPG